ncbi:MAG: winged helix-turn-helix transcriptional regulator [Promethearchaeota archaeon]
MNLIFSAASFVEARNVNVPGFFYNDKISGGEGWVSYSFFQNNIIKIASNSDIDIQINFDHRLSNRKIAMNITEDSHSQILIDNKEYLEQFQSKEIRRGQNRFQQRWNSYIKISPNTTIDKIEIKLTVGNLYSINKDDKFWISKGDDNWEILDTQYISAEESDEGEEQIATTLTNIDSTIYISVFSPEFNYGLIIIIALIAISVFSVVLVMSKSEYRKFIKNRIFINTSVHRLSIEEVLENENRSKILDLILEEPGIHFNELLRRTNISPGNLVWHLDILESYKVIGKKNIGQYICYFPYYNTNPIKSIDIKLRKSKVTLEILDMIENNPGIYINQIAKTLNLDHKTVLYHVNKLIEANLIETKKKGRKKLLYPKVGEIKELNIDKEKVLNGEPEGPI